VGRWGRRFAELIAWRISEEPKEIAAAYQLGRRCVEQVIYPGVSTGSARD
jgi:hypothetical protein